MPAAAEPRLQQVLEAEQIGRVGQQTARPGPGAADHRLSVGEQLHVQLVRVAQTERVGAAQVERERRVARQRAARRVHAPRLSRGRLRRRLAALHL